MADARATQQLIARLSEGVDRSTAVRLVERLAAMDQIHDHVAAVSALLDELTGISVKAAQGAIEALPELDRRGGLSCASAWLDVGVALAESSGATALKYWKDSPVALGLIEPPEGRTAALNLMLELAEQDANVALEFLRTAPRLCTVVPFDQLPAWLDIGIELTRADVVVGLEYIRQLPAVAAVLPVSDVRDWLAFGMKLIQPNSLGKPDYLGTMEYLRTSPAILGDLEQPSIRSRVVALGALLADRSPDIAVAWLGDAPRLLRGLPSPDWQHKVLRYGSLIAERDAEAAIAYLRRCPELVALIGEDPTAAERFDTWFKTGMDILAYGADGARAYFGLESRRALASVEEAVSGVPLRRVARTIKLFVQGLCGSDVSILAAPDSLTSPIPRASVSADGRCISLPAVLRRYPTSADNERLYLLMAAHEAGHLEFGTYRLTLDAVHDLVEDVRRRYGRDHHGAPDSLDAFFRLYPQPRLVQDLWTVLEDARVDSLLQDAYPGLRTDLARIAAETIQPRDPAHGLTVKELLVDCLLRLSTGESEASAVPRAVRDEVAELWRMSQSLFRTTATAEETVRLADAIYVRMEELLAPRGGMIEAGEVEAPSQEPGAGPSASEELTKEYRPVTNWAYRGAMNPEFIRRAEDHTAEQREDRAAGHASAGGGSKERGGDAGSGPRSDSQSMIGEVLGGGRSLPTLVEELLALEVDERPPRESAPLQTRAVRYPEWDATIADYRPRWCRVIERPADAGSDESVVATLAAHRSAVALLRRFFETLRPPATRRVPQQADGEELDIDAVVRRAAELRAGWEGGDRIYTRREKKERDVAVAFLVDVSGSTSRQVEEGRRVIDIERDSLVLLCEALEAVGDQYALYAYSGAGREQVEFMTVKDFDEPLGPGTAHRLGGLAPRQQNRDGAAIRHAAAKLLARPVKTRLLVVLSDGRPLDGGYKDEYALEDTKAALREARRRGVELFCVTIDREADNYLRRMYGDVGYMVIDRVETLPSRLPRMYQRLTRA